MRDRPAEGTTGRPLGIDVDPLVVVGGIGEQIHTVLSDLQPLRGSELRPLLRCDELAEILELLHCVFSFDPWPPIPASRCHHSVTPDVTPEVTTEVTPTQ